MTGILARSSNFFPLIDFLYNIGVEKLSGLRPLSIHKDFYRDESPGQTPASSLLEGQVFLQSREETFVLIKMDLCSED